VPFCCYQVRVTSAANYLPAGYTGQRTIGTGVFAITAREQTVEVPAAGTRFHACLRGDAPDVVLLHGFSGDLHTWDTVWPLMDPRVGALRYDLRGFGRSGAGEGEPFSHADDLLQLLDSLGRHTVDLVGVSMGGAVALNFALDHPERVRRLVLISPALVAWEWSAQWLALWRPIVELARAGDMEGARALWWQHPLFATTRASAGADLLEQSIQRYSGAQWVYDAQRSALPDLERVHQLQPPTLLLTGAEDLPDFRLIADLLEASAPAVSRIDCPGLGHLVHLERPAACARCIRAFLKGDSVTAADWRRWAASG
jgi:pimeloyl-ACP methyl ester carboxylesterase